MFLVRDWQQRIIPYLIDFYVPKGGIRFLSVFLFVICGNWVIGQSDISIADAGSVNEGDAGPTTLTFTVSIDASDPLLEITVDYSTVGGDAPSGTLTFPANTTDLDQDIEVTTIGDTAPEATEIVIVTLSNASANATIIDTEATGAFLNDDFVVADISIADAGSVNEGNAGPTTLTFTVSIDQSDPFGNITVDYGTVGGDAPSGTLTFLAGTTELDQDILVTTTGDTTPELDEVVTVTLSNASANGTIIDTEATGTFLNDDFVVADISIADAGSVNEGNAGPTTLTFTVSIDQSDPLADITVDYSTVGGNTPSGTLTFLAGTT
ncbi:MAG: hypothetical protein AAF717_08145, partial [Bacteroidota bacterium]